MKLHWILLTLLGILALYARSEYHLNPTLKKELPVDSLLVDYALFEPKRIDDFLLKDYEIEDAYELDSFIVLTAYTEGDVSGSSNPTNWGDRLVLMKNGAIDYESRPAGDPYVFEPYFYHNLSNDKIIIICQLGDEQNYGGEAFLLVNGAIEFMGFVEIESPNETTGYDSLIDIIRVTEIEEAIYFHFEADSLIDLTNNDWNVVKNNDIHYVFKDHTLTLKGL